MTAPGPWRRLFQTPLEPARHPGEHEVRMLFDADGAASIAGSFSSLKPATPNTNAFLASYRASGSPFTSGLGVGD